MHESSLPVQLGRRVSRRSRPSLASFADSGYEPPGTSSYGSKASTALLPPRSLSRNGTLTRAGMSSSVRLDFDVASQLLAEDALIKDINASRPDLNAPRPPTAGKHPRLRSHSTIGPLKSPFNPLDGEGTYSRSYGRNSRSTEEYDDGSVSKSATISSAWSGVSNRLFLESIKDAGNERPTNCFTEQFDKLAKKHGIQPFPYDYRVEPESVSVSSASRGASSGATTPPLTGNRFWNRLLGRTPSTIDVSKKHGNIKMTLSSKRNPSLSDLAAVGRGKRDSLKGMHLEDMIRLGGVAIFNLPLGLAPGDLLIPTCMHAAASFILNNGLRTNGIFRVSGNLSTTFALYDFYQRQLEENNNEAVVATTALARLPNSIHYTIHDVAHLFKKLIHGLPGGLLGSPAVFQALYNVHTFVYADPELSDGMSKKVKPRMIALALASINLHFRIALICAVFGLLRAINLASEQETQTKVKDPHETFYAMKDDALGTVFGPLLLGDKSAHILVDEVEDRGGLLVLPKVNPETNLSRSKSKKGVDMGVQKREFEKSKRAAVVCQMLIDNWEDVCYQLKRINALGVTAQAYDLPAQANKINNMKFAEVASIPESEPMQYQQPNRSGSHRSRRSRSHSQPHHKRNGSGNGTWTLDDEKEYHHNLFHGHHLHVPKHIPHFGKNKVHQQVDDLIAFSTRNSKEVKRTSEQMFGELFSVPLAQPELSTIGEMTPVPELPTPTTMSPEGSPNWKPLAPATPIREPEFDSEEESPNVRVIAEDTPVRGYYHERRPETPTRRGQTPSSGSSTERGSPESDLTPQAANKWSEPPVSYTTSPSSDIAPEVAKKRSPPSMSMFSDFSPSSQVTPQLARRRMSEAIMSTTASPASDIPPMVARRRPPPSISTFSGAFSDSSPASVITPQLATGRIPPLNFEVAPRGFSEEVVLERPDPPTPLSAPIELESSFSQRPISPVPELSAAIREVETEPEDTPRPITPPPLSFKKKKPPTNSFSIFQDTSPTPNPLSPSVTLRKPNSSSNITIKPPPAAEDSHPLQPSTPNRRPRANTNSTVADDSPSPQSKKKGGNTALYAEIRRLQRLVDIKTEEAKSTRMELELAQNMANAGTLSHIVRETQEELKVWRNRAEWAEKQLRMRGVEDGRATGVAVGMGHQTRRSLG